jgi:four helix bundle protein
LAPVFDHEKLDVYRVGLQFVTWAHKVAVGLSGLHRTARGHLVDASQSITQNIAEGNGKRSRADRRLFFAIARGSALECAAVLDNLAACEAIAGETAGEGKRYLHRLVCMLTRMTDPAGRVSEELVDYEHEHAHEHEAQGAPCG